ncbi:S-(hydroxymethyl)glutathione dehydrogenase [Acrasis kona]|uniref:S-(Hydroxymethyl)glutathione dehydrogenase n=1 Tax=Acrasis kona TaxID=1008807 RepID=A0AAW2YTZ5_9EUKA
MAETIGKILRPLLPETKEIKDLPNAITSDTKRDPNSTMKVLAWKGKDLLNVETMQKPLITDPKDVIIKVTSAAICGSDLHLYHEEFSGMHKGDVLGHEFAGIIEDAGSEVQLFKKGQRVVVSAVIACGYCEYCKKEQYSACDNTNTSKEMEAIMGHRCAGFFGYSHLTGGWQGGQAEYTRVPFADVNLLPIPDELTDEQVVTLSDIACTAWHGLELGEVKKGQTIAIWGCGPVGLIAIMWAKMRGVHRIIAIDNVPKRLQLAQDLGAEVLNFDENKVIPTMLEICKGGPDVCIDATGFRYAKEAIHKIERVLRLETDATSAIVEAIYLVKKFGHLSVIGDYYGTTNHFPIGALFDKGITFRAGVVCPQKYWKELLKYIQEGKVDLTKIITHIMPLEEAPKAYQLFDEKKNDCIKVILKPGTRQ